MADEQYSNAAATTLNGAINSSVVTLVAADGSTFPAAGDFRIKIDSEIIVVGARSGNTLSSLTRAAEGTTAASHADAAAVEHVLTAAGLSNLLLLGYGVRIATNTLAIDTASVTFSSIPQTYRHLAMTCMGRSVAALTIDDLVFRFNGDTAANYDRQYIYSEGTAVTGGETIGATSLATMAIAAANSPANNAGGSQVIIYDYARTNWNKVLSAICAVDRTNAANGQAFMLNSGSWRSTAAITSITTFLSSGSNIKAETTFALYGMV